MESAEELAKMISSNKHLTAINLNDCNMNEKMNTLILQAMDSLGDQLNLQKVGYKYNELYEDQQKQFIDILMRNKHSLKKIQIQGNDIEEQVQEYYLKTFQQNKVDISVLSKFESDDDDDEA